MDGPGEYSLYDVARDPGESNDLLASNRVTAEMKQIAGELAGRLRDAVPPFERPKTPAAPVDRELEKRLRSLGYLDEKK